MYSRSGTDDISSIDPGSIGTCSFLVSLNTQYTRWDPGDWDPGLYNGRIFDGKMRYNGTAVHLYSVV